MKHPWNSIDRKLVFSAPMAGYTDCVYRRFAKKFGADLTFTEMISAEGFIRYSKETLRLLQFDSSETPIGVQFFTANPDTMAATARKLVNLGFCVIDINMGCSVKKVIKRGAGAALLRTPNRAIEIVTAAMEAKIPVSVKVRSGFNSQDEWRTVLNLLTRLEEIGLAFVTIHPRTATQLFSGQANWSILKDAVNALSIPVIGSGDLFTIEDVLAMIELTDVAGVALARGAIANFSLFTQARALVQNCKIPPISIAQRAETMFNFIKDEIKMRGEERAIRWCRKFFPYLLTSFPGARQMRKTLNHIKTLEELKRNIFIPLALNEHCRKMKPHKI